MLIFYMINQVKCTELCSLKKYILKGSLFGYNWIRKVRVSFLTDRQRFQQLNVKGEIVLI